MLFRSRPGVYDSVSRNKAPFLRPVTSSAASLTGPFSKMAGIHTQVSLRVTSCLLGRKEEVRWITTLPDLYVLCVWIQ